MAIGVATADPKGTLTRRASYEAVRASLLQERTTFDPHWRELGDYLLPRRTRFFAGDRNKGDKRNANIIDSTPRFAARTLQSGLHAGLTSPARPWMRLTTPDPDLAEFGPVKSWLHTVTRRLLDVFLKSNLYNALPTVYGDMGVFATAAVGVLEDTRDLMRCYCYPIGSYAIGLDDRGIATAWVRDYSMSVRQLVMQFGSDDGGKTIKWSRFSTAVKAAWDAGNYEMPIEVTWFVGPNLEQEPRALEARRSMPWHSVHFERGRESGGEFLREGGFRQFPILVPRWDVTAEDNYGTDCPGMTALGDIKALQVMQKRKAQAVDKALNPPLVGPAILRSQKTSLLPGDITYADVRDGMQGLRPIHEVRLEGIQHMGLDIQEHQQRINRAFYADLFLMLANSNFGQPVTAREIEERHEEKLLALGPVLERLNDELLDPLVERAYALLEQAGGVPEPPEELDGVDLKVEYISIMAQAQKLVGVVGLDRLAQSTAVLAQTWPEARHKFDAMQAVDEYGDMLGAAPKVIRTDEDAAAALQAEQQAVAAEAEAKQLQAAAGAARNLSQTSLEGDNALRRLVEGVA